MCVSLWVKNKLWSRYVFLTFRLERANASCGNDDWLTDWLTARDLRENTSIVYKWRPTDVRSPRAQHTKLNVTSRACERAASPTPVRRQRRTILLFPLSRRLARWLPRNIIILSCLTRTLGGGGGLYFLTFEFFSPDTSVSFFVTIKKYTRVYDNSSPSRATSGLKNCENW